MNAEIPVTEAEARRGIKLCTRSCPTFAVIEVNTQLEHLAGIDDPFVGVDHPSLGTSLWTTYAALAWDVAYALGKIDEPCPVKKGPD